MAATTTPVRDSGSQEAPAAQAPAEQPSQAPTPPAAPGAEGETGETTPVPSRAPYETGNSLLAPPDYDNIVGGVPPSPYASLILLAGLICVVASSVGTAMGVDMSQWWVLGAALIVVAVFLAGFVSRA